MSEPTVSGQGSNGTSASGINVNLPAAAPTVGDRAFIVIAHRDNALGTPTPSDTAGFGPWSQVAGSPVVQGAARLTVWESTVESTTPTAPVLSDSGDHQQSRCFYVSHPDGTPEIYDTEPSVDATSDTSGVAPCPDSPVADCLVFLFAAGDTPDVNNTNEYGSVANADLTSVTERADNAVQTGGGSSKLIASGVKASAGSIADWTYTKANAGVKAHLVVIVGPPATVTTHFGDFSLDLTLDRDFTALKQTFGEFALPITVGEDFDAVRTTFSEFSLPLSFERDFEAVRTTFSEFSLPLIFDRDFEAIRKTFGEFTLPIIFDAEFDGIGSTGPQTKFGEFSLDLSFGSDFEGVRTAFGEFSLPLNFDRDFEAVRTAFGQFSLPLIFNSEFGPARLTVHGSFDLSLLAGFDWIGHAELIGIILNNADAVYLGSVEVEKVYYGNIQVWP